MTENKCVSPIISELTKHVIEIISEEIMSHEHQLKIKKNIIIPVINMMYTQLYPYIIGMIIAIILLIILSMLTFILFLFYLFAPSMHKN